MVAVRSANPECVLAVGGTSLLPTSKKAAAGATLVFLDEVGLSLKKTAEHTWEPPVMSGKASRDKVSTIGAVASAGQFLHHMQHGAFTGHEVIRFLQHVLTHVPGEVVVVLDNAGIHTSKRVTAFATGEARLSLRYPRPYAPALNPIELVRAYVLGNFCARTLQELKARLKVGWPCVRYVGSLIVSCTATFRLNLSRPH